MFLGVVVACKTSLFPYICFNICSLDPHENSTTSNHLSGVLVVISSDPGKGILQAFMACPSPALYPEFPLYTLNHNITFFSLYLESPF